MLRLGGGAEKLADGAGGEWQMEIALDREAADAHGEQLRERRVAPLVAVGAEGRDAEAEEEKVLPARLSSVTKNV